MVLLGIILSILLSWNGIIFVGSSLSAYSIFLPAIILAVVIQFLGHVYRARRTKLLLDQATPSSLKFQFGALSIGYLFNTLFTLRIGEIVRAYIIARRIHISLLYTVVAVLLERSIDILFFSLIVCIFALAIPNSITGGLLVIALVASSLSILFIGGVVLLKNENKHLLKITASITRVFNNKINNSLRFKVWSLIYGLQSFFDNKTLVKQYASYTVVSWASYLASTFVVLISLFSPARLFESLYTTISVYVVGLPGVISLQPDAFTSMADLLKFGMDDVSGAHAAGVIWFVLVIPIALTGLLALIVYRARGKNGLPPIHPDAYTNKLLRYDDISQDFPAFLESYFKGFNLSRLLHKIEVNGELSLVKFFKGGSDAITVLALRDGKLFVKKIVPAEYTSRLKVQYEWLKKFENKKAIVSVLSQQETDDYYAIDLEYNPTNISLFEYVHTHSFEQSKVILDKVWAYAFKNIYTLTAEKVNTKELNAYVEDRLIKKMDSAISANQELRDISEEPTIKINGQMYDNFYQILDKIRRDKVIWKDLATYRGTKIAHGDMTIDNILVNAENAKPFIIDPSDDNQVRGPIIDYGRHMQSLIGGYEFLNNDEEPVYATREDDIATINYHDRRSARYMELSSYVVNELSEKYFTDHERKAVLFHVGLLYGRMLAHRVVINPDTTLKYYAVSVQYLNEFYRQYS